MTVPAADIDVTNTILSYVADVSGTLIVMGGYGHAKLREMILAAPVDDCSGIHVALIGQPAVPRRGASTMRPGLYAFTAAASFLGATTYIGLVEQLARLALSGAAMLREWKWSNRRGTLALSVFAVVSAIHAYIQLKTNGDLRWLIGGTIILASWPYANFVMMPVNVWFFVVPPGTAVSPLRKLMQDWGLLEWGHVLIGFAAACVFAWALELPL